MISVILPTYNEMQNIPVIVPAIAGVCRGAGLDFEILVIDDESTDGTASEAMELADEYPVRVHVRRGMRGLATAVMKGWELARGEVCVLMDADMSHPVEKIPEMVQPILEGRAEVTVGSRHAKEGGAEGWPWIRRVVSRVSGLLARGVTELSDPTSGFMAVRKSRFDGVKLDPVGWKIVLKVVVKTRSRLVEVPIVFANRVTGRSKLNFKAQRDYVVHLWKLYNHVHQTFLQFVKFCMVGLSGLAVDTAVLMLLVENLASDPRFAAVFSFTVAVSWNYRWNRSWTFGVGRETRWLSGFAAFAVVCLAGLCVRLTTMHLLMRYGGMGEGYWYILASIIGIVTGIAANFTGSKFLVFGRTAADAEAARQSR